MFDAYALVRRELAAWLSQCWGRTVLPEIIRCKDPRAQISTPAALSLGLEPARLYEELVAEQGKFFILDTPALLSIQEHNGHLHFALTPALHTQMMRRVCQDTPLPPLCLDARDVCSRARNRMLILARQPYRDCPQEEAVCRALWMALGIGEQGIEPRIRELRRREAGQALLTMAHHLRPRERQALLTEAAGAAACAARLLAYFPSDHQPEKG